MNNEWDLSSRIGSLIFWANISTDGRKSVFEHQIRLLQIQNYTNSLTYLSIFGGFNKTNDEINTILLCMWFYGCVKYACNLIHLCFGQTFLATPKYTCPCPFFHYRLSNGNNNNNLYFIIYHKMTNYNVGNGQQYECNIC